jgi:hypothetical protein
MDFSEARPLPPRTRLAAGHALADDEGRGSKRTEQPQPTTESEV